jgi:hypothetical protein
MKKQEENLQVAVCQYLRLQYPLVIFMSDIASGLRLSIGQAVKSKKLRSSRGQPDLFIAESRPNQDYKNGITELPSSGSIPSGFSINIAALPKDISAKELLLMMKESGVSIHHTNIIKYHGLFLELKKEGARIWKKNGDPADAHIAEQKELLSKLTVKGYKAEFAIGFEQAKKMIDEYLK